MHLIVGCLTKIFGSHHDPELKYHFSDLSMSKVTRHYFIRPAMIESRPNCFPDGAHFASSRRPIRYFPDSL